LALFYTTFTEGKPYLGAASEHPIRVSSSGYFSLDRRLKEEREEDGRKELVVCECWNSVFVTDHIFP